MNTNFSSKLTIVKFSPDSIFNNTKFVKLWSAQLFSQSAVHMLNFVLAVTIYNITQSNQAVSFLVFSYGLAALLFGALAGVIVDHTGKKRVLLYSTIFRFLLIILLITLTHNILTTIALAFLFNSMTQFFFPAEGSSIPLLVDKSNLLTANSLFTLTFYVSQILGYLFGGILLLDFGLNNTLVIIALLFFCAFLFIKSIDFPRENIQKITLSNIIKKVNSELINGFKYIDSNNNVKEPLAYLSISGIIIGMFLVLLPGYGVEVLGLQAEKTSLYLITPLAIGIITGAITINKFTGKYSRDKLVNIGIMLAGMGLLFLSLTKRVPINGIKQYTGKLTPIQTYLPELVNKVLGVDILLFAIIFMFIIGFANSFISIVNNTNLQEKTQKGMRGRIYGVLQTFVIAFASIPVLLTGYLSDNIGITTMIAITGMFLILLHVIIRLKFKKPIF